MSWRYIASINEDGEWDVREFYESKSAEETSRAWTNDSINPCGSTREELISSLQMMLTDVLSGEYLDTRDNSIGFV